MWSQGDIIKVAQQAWVRHERTAAQERTTSSWFRPFTGLVAELSISLPLQRLGLETYL